MEIKEPKENKVKKIKSFSVDEAVWVEFLGRIKDKHLSVSGVLSDFMKEVNSIIADGGGEITFGIEGKDWFNPTTDDKIKLCENRLADLRDRKQKEGGNQS